MPISFDNSCSVSVQQQPFLGFEGIKNVEGAIASQLEQYVGMVNTQSVRTSIEREVGKCV